MTEPLEGLISRGQRALDSMQEAAETLAGLRIVHRSPDGVVEVEVDSHGAVVGLDLAPDLTRESASRLGSVIVATAEAAARDALARREVILRDMQSSLTET